MAMNISYGNTSRKKGFRIEPFGKSSILVTYTLLGSDPCIGYWVGSWWGESVNGTHGALHEIRVMCSEPGSQIHAFVRLFAQFGAPEYHVLLGLADPQFVASSAWPSVWNQDPAPMRH